MKLSSNNSDSNLESSQSGLDFDFLRYFDVQSQTQQHIQSYYLPFFKDCQNVIDLACGDGDFVLLLQGLGIRVLGVDSDIKAATAAAKKGIPFIEKDVFDYLADQPDQSVDGIFCAHLVEHLPYPKVMELVRQSFRILQPGGRIVLATPNARSLYSHLEMFYLHFGHVSFYHPRLLCFFLDHEGFTDSQEGVNTNTASPMMVDLQRIAQSGPGLHSVESGALQWSLNYQSEPPLMGKSLIRRLSFLAKRWLSRMIVRPLTDSLAQRVEILVNQSVVPQLRQIDQSLIAQQRQLHTIAASIQSLNGPFECYATAVKPNARQQTPAETSSAVIKPVDPVYSYKEWIADFEPSPTQLELQRSESTLFPVQPLFSFITPVYNPPLYALQATAESVYAQTYSHWEWCLANGGDDPEVHEYLDQLAAQDSRIKVKHLEQNYGISGNSNQALDIATGDFVALLDHDDTVAPGLLFEVTEILQQNSNLDIFYFDEDKLTQDGSDRRDPWMKPTWSPDMMLTVNLLGHAVLRRSLVLDAGGFDSDCDGAQDWDLGLRCSERSNAIVHIPKVLYHWRMIPGSASVEVNAKPWAYEAQVRAITLHLQRKGESVRQVESIPGKGVTISFQSEPTLVSIIIPTKDNVVLLRRCIDSLFKTTRNGEIEIILVDTGSERSETLDYYQSLRDDAKHAAAINFVHYEGDFNFSKANNLGANRAKGELLLFLNNDTEAIEPGWLDLMVGWSKRESIGVVGAKLLYPDQRIQHAGVILSMSGHADHVYWGMGENSFGVFGSSEWVRNYLAVTGAFQMIKRQLFLELGGFDEHYALCFSDVELCLRAIERGYRNLYLPFVRFYHHEGASRGGHIPQSDVLRATEHFAHYIVHGDPYYSSNLSYQNRQPRLLTSGEPTRVEAIENVLRAFQLPTFTTLCSNH